MTYSDIVHDFEKMNKEYLTYINKTYDDNAPYREKMFYSGLAIQTLQNIQELASRYPLVAKKLPFGAVPDYSNQAINRVFEAQRRIYLQELKKLKSKISKGTYNLNDEMSLKVERLRDINSIINDNRNLNIADGAFDEKKRMMFSIAGTALKYPVHVVTKTLEATGRVIGKVLSLPLHAIAYATKFMIKPESPYNGKVVNNIGDKLGDFLSTGARIVDHGIKKL